MSEPTHPCCEFHRPREQLHLVGCDYVRGQGWVCKEGCPVPPPPPPVPEAPETCIRCGKPLEVEGDDGRCLGCT